MQGSPDGDDLLTTVVGGRSSSVEEVDRSSSLPEGGRGGGGQCGGRVVFVPVWMGMVVQLVVRWVIEHAVVSLMSRASTQRT